jgi:hypothetical protein
MSWTVPGYTAERMLGFGATGEVWAGRDDATGERVALKRLRTGGDREVLRREAALLAAFRHEHVVRLRGVLGVGDGLVLVLDLAEGGSFAGLLAVRGRLAAVEVAALCAPLADALAAAHAAGLVHGDLSPGNLLLDARGRPLVADLGTARLVGDASELVEGTAGYVDPAVLAGSPPVPASDVYGLAAVAAHLLTGEPPAPGATGPGLLGALAPSLHPDPARRPPAAGLRAVFAAAAGDGVADLDDAVLRRVVLGGAQTRAIPRPVPAPEPAVGRWRVLGARIRGWAARPWRRRDEPGPSGAAGPRSRPVPAVRDRRRPSSRLRRPLLPGVAGAVVSGAVVVLGLVAALIWATAPGPPVGSRPVTAAQPGSGGAAFWRTVIERLDADRSAAFAHGDAGALTRVYVAGSEPARADAHRIADLARVGTRATGVRHVVVSVRVESVTRARARVLLTDRMPAYRVVDTRGAVRSRVGPRGSRTVRLDLVPVPGGWRIAAVSAT